MDQADFDRLMAANAPIPPPPVDQQGKAGYDFFQGVFQGGQEALPQGPSVITKEDRERARFLIQELAQLQRQTNFTASLPAYNAPHLWSDPIDLSGTRSVPAAVEADYTTVLLYRVLPSRWGVIQGYGVDVQDAAYTYDGSILWRIRKNGLEVQTLSNWGEHRGSMARPRPTFIVLAEGDIVTFEVRRAVAAGGAQNVAMSMTGWTWRPRFNYEGTKVGVTAT